MRPGGLTRWLIDRLLGRGRDGAGGSSAPERESSVQVGARAMSLELSNVAAVARREYLARARTRTFRITTILLVIAALGIALAPILIRWVDRGSGPTAIELSVGTSKPSVNVAAALNGLLNGASATGAAGAAGSSPDYQVTTTEDVAGARARVDAGKSAGLLIVTRSADGELAFTFVTKARSIERIAQLMRGAVSAIAVDDRLARAGLSQVDQAKLFLPPAYAAETPSGGQGGTGTAESAVNEFAIGFVLSIVLFMAIILYGQWVAYSVAEEKSSRVMEVILGAASPFELLAGKVV